MMWMDVGRSIPSTVCALGGGGAASAECGSESRDLFLTDWGAWGGIAAVGGP